jgi:hypothetical protein
MAFFYALSSLDPEKYLYEVLGKGVLSSWGVSDGRARVPEGPEAEALRRHLFVLERAEAEERGLIPRGAPVIWYARLGYYRAEEHDAPVAGPEPTGVTSR